MEVTGVLWLVFPSLLLVPSSVSSDFSSPEGYLLDTDCNCTQTISSKCVFHHFIECELENEWLDTIENINYTLLTPVQDILCLQFRMLPGISRVLPWREPAIDSIKRICRNEHNCSFDVEISSFPWCFACSTVTFSCKQGNETTQDPGSGSGSGNNVTGVLAADEDKTITVIAAAAGASGTLLLAVFGAASAVCCIRARRSVPPPTQESPLPVGISQDTSTGSTPRLHDNSNGMLAPGEPGNQSPGPDLEDFYDALGGRRPRDNSPSPGVYAHLFQESEGHGLYDRLQKK